MSTEKQVAGSQDEKQRAQKRRLEAATEQLGEQVAFDEPFDGLLAAAGDIPVQDVAARLGDARFQSVQRQAMADRIRRTSGNQRLQSVVRSLTLSKRGHLTEAHVQRQEEEQQAPGEEGQEQKGPSEVEVSAVGGPPPPPPQAEQGELPAVQTQTHLPGGGGGVIQRIDPVAAAALAYTILSGAIATVQQGDIHVTWPTTEVGVIAREPRPGVRQGTRTLRPIIFSYRKTNPISGIEQVNIQLRSVVQYNGQEVQASFGFTAGGRRSRLMRDSYVDIRNPVSLRTVAASAEWQRVGVSEFPVVRVPIEVRVDHPWPQSNDEWTFDLVLSGMYGLGTSDGASGIENLQHVET